MAAARVVLGIAIGYALNLAVNYTLTQAGVVPGSVPHANIRIISTIAAANLAMAIIAGYVCATTAGRGRIFLATSGLMAAYAVGGIRAGRQLVASGQMPFSSAIITLLCISLVPIGAVLYANRAARPR
jgi:hypothetical protein